MLCVFAALIAGIDLPARAETKSMATDFGAAGDGAHDDTAAIQRAAESGPLRFGPGVYRISQPIVIDLATHGYSGVTGDAGAVQIIMEGPGPALHLIGDHGGTANPNSVQPGVWARQRFPVISGIEIVGRHPEAEGIRLERTMQCTITRVLIRKCLHGIRLVDRNRNFILSDSHLYENIETGLFLDHVNLHQINIIGNHISYSGRSGIHVLNGEVRNIQITGNDIEYNHRLPDAADVLIDTRTGTLREFTITGNTIQAVVSAGGANVRILGAEADASDQSGLGTITGNLIGSQTTNIDLQHTRGVTVAGNSIYSAAELSVHARDCRNLVVTGNSIDYNPGVQDRMRDGILLENCEDVMVSGNVLVDCRWGDPGRGGAVTIMNSRNITITGCIIPEPLLRGIHVLNSHNCRITNNIITDSEQRMLEAVAVDEESTGITVEDNNLPDI